MTHVSVPNFRRYYLSGSVPHGAMRGHAELHGESARTIYEAVRAEPGIKLVELARRAQVSEAAAHRTVERLRRAGLLEKAVHGREVRITAREPMSGWR